MTRDDGTLPLPGAAAPPAAADTVRGVVKNVVYRNDEGTYSVVRLTLLNGDEATVVGPLGDLAPGEPVRVTGRYEDSRTHGRQFRAQGVFPELPTTSVGIEKLLGSGFVGNIGPAIAKRIVQRFGTSTLDVIADHPERLKEVEGVGKTRAHAIQEAFRARRAEAESKAFLQGLGLGPALSRRVWERFGADAAKVIRDNPYRLAEEVAGIGFLTADAAAKKQGIADTDPRRVAGAAVYLLLDAVDEGHTALPPDELVARAEKFGVDPDLTRVALRELAARKTVVLDRHRVYPPPLFEAESRLARDIARVLKLGVAPVPDALLTRGPVAQALAPLHPRQREAVVATMREPFLVLTGGPGTGKTTTVKALVALQRAAGHKIVLAAPTGRAAKRLAEATGHPAGTIHRLLEWTPRVQRFARNEGSPLDADVVLVDEASMLDIQLGSALVRALRPGARMVLVGDADQLPPVGPGTVLADLLATPEVRAVRLTEVFRQATSSAIVRGAYEVLKGAVPRPSPPRAPVPEGAAPVPPAGELYVVERDEADEAAAVLVDLVAKRLARSFGVHPIRDVQVLVPTHRGPLGAQALNEALQQALNPGVARGRRGLSPGDKVMQHKNDYDLDVWNGDLGVVARLEGEKVVATIDGREVLYGGAAVENLSLAYAATVHKSQGSEYDAVVIGLHTSHFVLLNRALLYTAITRARRLAVIVGSPKALRLAVDTARVVERHGALRERLRDELTIAAVRPRP
ncbi:MAG: ATP-dependent RecD-like DNA helicase [Polyangiales bacterium]